MKPLVFCSLVSLILLAGAAATAHAVTLTLRQDEATNTISVYRDNVAEPILTQNARPDFRPYLHPIVAPDGKGVLTEFSPAHHKHQTGLYWGFTKVNGRDYFHNPSNGYWRRVSSKPIVAKGESVKWSTVYHLLDAAGQPIMAETQVWTMRDSGDRYLLDLEWTGEGLVDITVGRYDYGGLFLRMPWRDGMEGAAVNSNGKRNGDATGQTASWVDVGMKLEGRSDQAHIVIFDHPKNTSYPLPWRVDGQLGIGPCRAIAGDWIIAKGKSETIRHQFVVYTGDFKEETINEAWQKYSGKMIVPVSTPPVQETAQYQGSQRSGPLTILTTPEGANLPAGTVVEGFPLLVRLDKDWFDFSKAKPAGEDIRFTAAGAPLPYQIEEWDAAKGTASIWVRIPKIEGNTRQTIHMHWGKADAASESNAKAVFNASNGYASVWHMADPVVDDAGGTESKDQGSTPTRGIVGPARHLAGKQGIFGGDKITGYPKGLGPMTTEAWFRAEQTNGTVIAWGEEKRPRKVMFNFLSPPRMAIECYFADVEAKTPLATNQWFHVVHTYSDKDSRVYVNGVLDGASTPVLDLPETSRLWIGGWYGNYKFVGDVDEVRISKVARSAEWIKLQYENQKPLQTLVGPVVQAGNTFAVSPPSATVPEGTTLTFTAQAGGAQKIYWTLKGEGRETLVAVDRFAYTFDAGRVSGDKTLTLQCKAVYPDGVKTKDIAISVNETIPDPVFTLKAPAEWDGRATITVEPLVTNLSAMQAKGAGELKTQWSAGPFAVIKEASPGKLILTRAQNSGKLVVTATISNGGAPVTQAATIAVTEPKVDPWVVRTPEKDEKPQQGQFYARDDKNEGTLYYNGTLTEEADGVFLKLYADDKLVKTETAKPASDKSYALSAKLKPGLIKYKVEFGTKIGAAETVQNTVNNLVCGDAYIIDGQSNALATDTGEKSPPETHEWIRSYGRPSQNPKDNQGNLWCLPVWKAQKGENAELGWWGMELAKRLVESQKMPIFIINAAVGGTRIDQHQRSATNPTDLTTIYGRMLWRVRQAKLTHGIRGILWHQGENDQGSDGPTGGYGWETYHQLFIEMSAGWKQDFPNVQHYYVFQIWPDSCSMGGKKGSGDMLREKQRTLPELYSSMSIMSTLGIRPPGGCHFPLVGWAEFSRLIQPLIERDNYGKTPAVSITPPNLRKAIRTAKDAIALEFDQPVVWADHLVSQFYVDGENDKIASGSVSGSVLTLKLKEPTAATKITYLKESRWSQDTLLIGANGIAALTFCNVPLQTE